jgi:hypothetical protein
MIKGYREKIEAEIAKICEDILEVLDKHLTCPTYTWQSISCHDGMVTGQPLTMNYR